MQNKNRVLIIGEVYVDVHLDTPSQLSRLGGIFHSVRAMAALKRPYAIAAITPEYLEKDIIDYAGKLDANEFSIVGNINRSPNVMLINEPTEANNQGYNDILVNQAEPEVRLQDIINLIDSFKPTDLLIYPGKYDFLAVLDIIKNYDCRIHIDFQYESEEINKIDENYNIEQIILSTTSKLFSEHSLGNSDNLVKLLKGRTRNILLKENRGGSRYFSYLSNNWAEAPAFLSDTVHSVGVGDVFNAVLISSNEEIKTSLKLASYVSSWYASTFNYNVFVSNVESLPNLKNLIKNLSGVRISWEERRNQHIYIAGPDFPHVGTKPIEEVFNSLEYHNFYPHRPIKENGLIDGSEHEHEQLKVYFTDLELLKKSSLLIAVLINDDPGTYVEIGWMAQSGKPTIIYDPNKKANNLFLIKTATVVCHTLTEVIDATFNILGERDDVE